MKKLSSFLAIILAVLGVSHIAFGSQVYGPAITSTIIPTGALNMGGFPITNGGTITGTNFVGTSTSATSTFASGIQITSSAGDYRTHPQVEFTSGNGFYSSAANTLSLAIGGSPSYYFDSSGINVNQVRGAKLRNIAPSATVPAFSFSNDTTTGIGSSAAGVMHLISTGNTVATASSTGSVSNFIVGGANALSNAFARQFTVNSSAGQAVVAAFTQNDGSGLLVDYGTTQNNADNGFRFINSGSGEASFVNGYDGTNNVYKIGIGAGAVSSAGKNFTLDGTLGWAGIATTSQASAFANGVLTVDVSNATAATTANGLTIIAPTSGSYSGNYLSLRDTTGASKMFVNQFGNLNANVGIGVTGVAGSSPAWGTINISQNSATAPLITGKAQTNPTTGDFLRFLSSTNLSLFTVNSNGNTIIGTSSTPYKFAIQDGFGGTADLFDVASTTSASYATTSIFRITNGGNVGIGTTSPATNLTVQGNMQAVIAAGVATSTCTTAIEGAQVYNLGNHHLWLCMGAEPWTLLK